VGFPWIERGVGDGGDLLEGVRLALPVRVSPPKNPAKTTASNQTKATGITGRYILASYPKGNRFKGRA